MQRSRKNSLNESCFAHRNLSITFSRFACTEIFKTAVKINNVYKTNDMHTYKMVLHKIITLCSNCMKNKIKINK